MGITMSETKPTWILSRSTEWPDGETPDLGLNYLVLSDIQILAICQSLGLLVKAYEHKTETSPSTALLDTIKPVLEKLQILFESELKTNTNC